MAASVERGTRERILEVAEAFLGERGYDGTRLHLIAQRVGIQKASLFHYFPSKEHLYRAVLDEEFGETEQTIRRVLESDGKPLDKLLSLVEAYVDMVAAHPARTKILLRQSLGDAPNSFPEHPESHRVLDLVVDFVAAGQRSGALAPIDPVAAVLAVVGMVAFFFTSAPVLAPTWCERPLSKEGVEQVKRCVVEVVRRCLALGEPAQPAVAQAQA